MDEALAELAPSVEWQVYMNDGLADDERVDVELGDLRRLLAAWGRWAQKAAWLLEHGATNEARDLCEDIIRGSSHE